MHAQAVESRSPKKDEGISLTTQVEEKLREVAKAIMLDISAQFEKGLTAQAALLRVENEDLRERLQTLEAKMGVSAYG